MVAAIYFRDGGIRTATGGGATEAAAELARRKKMKRDG
jgi:hypothetical protein